MIDRSLFRGSLIRGCAWALVAVAVLAGCSSGKDGAAGAPGTKGDPGAQGPPGSTGPILALDVSTAQTITAKITSVAGTTAPTISFSLADENGQPLKGLTAGSIRFAIAQLQPAVAGSGTSTQWRSYITTVENPSQTVGWGTTPQVQATAEVASTTNAVFKDNADGTYTYTFSKDLAAFAADSTTKGVALTFDGTLTHRVGLEIRGTTATPTNNAVYTYLPGGGSVTLTRDIVNNSECDACHDKLAFHGGPRTDVQYCVICHNSGTTDAQSGNSLDMKVMVHKIHRGISLPTVVAAGSTAPAQGVGYTIFGYGGSVNNFNTIVFPQDQRNCTTCHRDSDPTTPDANNYKNIPYSGACGTCHDNINFATGSGHGPAPGIIAADKDCATCHGPTSGLLSNGLAMTVVGAHVIPEKVAGTKFAYNILSVTNAAGASPVDGDQLKITYSITDPTNANAPYTLQTATPFSGTDGGGLVCKGGGAARLAIDVAWNTSDYTNYGSGALPAQPWSFNPLGVVAGCPPEAAATITGPDANGVYTLVTNKAGGLPAGIGTLGVVFEGHPAVDTKSVGTTSTWQRIAVKNAVSFVKVNDAKAVPRRDVVQIAKCDECHNSLTVHGNNRTDNPQSCVACHNPGATDAGRRASLATGFDPVDGLYEQPIDFKVMIHAIHGASFRASQGANPFIVYGFGGSKNDFGEVGYPGVVNNCEGCHAAGTYFPVDGTKVMATTTSTGAAVNTHNPNAPAATSANMAVCSACHTTTVAAAHMTQNGGSTTVQKDANGRTIPGGVVETCAICHGPGGAADVKVMHKVASFTN